MNETKSARYHRLKRRAGALSLLGRVAVLASALWLRPDLPLWVSVLVLLLVNEVIDLPLALYRSFILERRYELSSEPLGTWLRDHVKAFGIAALFAVAAAEGIYALIRWQPDRWWLLAAVAALAVTMGVARLGPVLLLPLFYRFKPLDRPALAERLLELSKQAGVPVLGVYEWGLGEKTRRANAALTGSGATRRILLSDTLLADYTDDEIEVIMAHELAHHVRHDIPKALALELVLLLAAFYAGSLALAAWWQPLGLRAPEDPRGLPLLVLAAGAVLLAATPLVNAVSRLNERQADRFALSLTRRADAFVTAMRRLGSQNLAEESPSRAAVLLFHTHPPIEERIASAELTQRVPGDSRCGCGDSR